MREAIYNLAEQLGGASGGFVEPRKQSDNLSYGAIMVPIRPFDDEAIDDF